MRSVVLTVMGALAVASVVASCVTRSTAGDACKGNQDCGDLTCISGTCGAAAGEEEDCPLGQAQCKPGLSCHTWGGGFPICSKMPCSGPADCPSKTCDMSGPVGVCFPKRLVIDGG